MSPFRFAFHIGWARPGVEVSGWRRLVGPVWVLVQR